MSQYQTEPERTFAAGEAMPAAYHLVKLATADNTVDLCDTQGEAAIGVTQNDALIGEAVLVRYANTSKVVAGAAIAKGAQITAGADARAETAATGDIAFGIALEAAGADGEVIEVLFTQHRNTIA